jgi:hypothetical protein
MFLKYKSRKAVKKIANGASAKEIQKAVGSVVREASRQLSRKINKMDYRLPSKIKFAR